MNETSSKLLNDGGLVPMIKTTQIRYEGDTYISRKDLVQWITELEVVCLSKEKRDAYRGIRLLLGQV